MMLRFVYLKLGHTNWITHLDVIAYRAHCGPRRWNYMTLEMVENNQNKIVLFVIEVSDTHENPDKLQKIAY